MNKLDVQHKHIIKLIGRDRGNDGWVGVSDQLYPVLSKHMPKELIEFSGAMGNYKARLTEEGESILTAMEWI